jgi:hypothetical protein
VVRRDRKNVRGVRKKIAATIRSPRPSASRMRNQNVTVVSAPSHTASTSVLFHFRCSVQAGVQKKAATANDVAARRGL